MSDSLFIVTVAHPLWILQRMHWFLSVYAFVEKIEYLWFYHPFAKKKTKNTTVYKLWMKRQRKFELTPYVNNNKW